MLKYFFPILGCFLLEVAQIYIWHKLLNKKINYKSVRMYITLISLTAISLLNFFLVNKFIKITIITIIFMLFFRFLFKENMQKSILTPVYYQMILVPAEALYVLFAALILKNNFDSFLNSNVGVLVTNGLIGIIAIFLVNIPIVKKIYKKMLEFTDKIKYIQLYLFCIIIMLVINVLLTSTYYKINFVYLFIFNVLLIFIFAFIILYSFRVQNKYNKVSDKYSVAINSLNDYETMMSKYRVSNHENKNLLLTVRAMILNKEKNIPQYIDSIIENRYKDDEKLFFEMSVIPSGGLRATIYSEILKIKNNKIDYTLNIDKKIKTIDFIELDDDTIIESCKVIGVLMDNAIEAVKDLKNKNIVISLFINNNMLNIEVSNNYKGNIEIDKINELGYTTKSEGHGYGLALVKKIVEENKLFELNTQVSKNVFSQVFSIELKK